MPSRPVDAVIERNNLTGEVTVVRAGPLIRVNPQLLDQELHAWVWDGTTLQLDTAGLYRYRKVGPDPDDPLRTLLFERIEDNPGDYKGVPQ